MSDWVDVSADAAQPPPAQPASPLVASQSQPKTPASVTTSTTDPVGHLVSRGMDPFDADLVVGACGAASLQDLKLVDSAMAAQAAAEAGLKLIPTRKWTNAVLELAASGEEGPSTTTRAAADAAASHGASASSDEDCVIEPPFVQGLPGP